MAKGLLRKSQFMASEPDTTAGTVKSMTIKPGEGERAARIGYEAQDKRAASIIYDILIEGRLEWFKIADPNAGRVDDIQISSIDGELHAYQVKWAETTQIISFSELTSASQGSSLIAQLADGWQKLREQHLGKRIFVHLIHRHIPSARPLSKAKIPLDTPPPAQPHFQSFVQECWKDKREWLNSGLGGIPQGWRSAMELIRKETGLTDEEDYLHFIAACSLHFGYQFPESEEPSDRGAMRRERDIDQLARMIAKLGGGERRIIQVTRAGLLRQLGWESRFDFRFKHEFPVDAALYQPIASTVEKLEAAITQFKSGYLALLGTPGSGKSTILTQTLRYRQGLRVIRYYAYVPNTPWQEGRGEAVSFLHDMYLALQRHGIHDLAGNQSQPETLEELRCGISAQLAFVHEKWHEDRILTLIVIDGLDHIEREQSPVHSLIKELPAPESVPEGVLLILGSQTLSLADFPSRIRHHLEQPGRTLTLGALTRQAVFNIVQASALPVPLSHEQQESVNTLSNGHPLALRYLLANLKNANDQDDVDVILNSTQPYGAHIEDDYKVYWDMLQQHESLRELLALLSRLRGPFDPQELLNWMPENTVSHLVYKARHYFLEESETRWHFFHNSFRQFILAQTRLNVLGHEDPLQDKVYHRRLADYSAASEPKKPWAWEELYHRACSEDWDKVLQLATQDYFRKQFYNLRAVEAILQDTALCLKAARKKHDGLAIIRTFLIEKELSDRQQNIDLIDLNLPRLLYEVQGMDVSMHYVMDLQQPLIEQKKGLRFAAFLVDKGEMKAAERVFNAYEPLEILNGPTLIQIGNGENIETIWAWIGVAHYFRSLDKIFSVIGMLRADTAHMWQDQDPEALHRGIRQNVLMALTHSLLDARDEKKLKQFRNLLLLHGEGEIFSRELDLATCECPNRDESVSAALERLMDCVEKAEFSARTKLRILECILRIRKDTGAVARLLVGMCQPPLQEAEIGSSSWSWKDLTPFSLRIRLNRLLAALGKPVEPIHAVPDGEPRHHGGVLFERNLVIIANLWGHARAGRTISPAMILHELHPALSLFSRRWQETHEWTSWYLYNKLAPDFFTLMIDAVAEHGPEALEALAEEFDRRWQARPDYWQTSWQRAIALALFRNGGAVNDLVRRLAAIEARFSVSSELTYLASELPEQAFAWLEAGQLPKAKALFPQLFEDSFGIVHDKDYQFSDWVKWLGIVTSALPGSTAEDIRRFCRALVLLEETERGRGTQDAANDLIALVSGWHPGYALELMDWLLSLHGIQYTSAMEGILRSAALSPDVPLELVFIITCHLLIPFSLNIPTHLPKILARQTVLKCPPEEAQALMQMLENAVEIKAFPSDRTAWWRGIVNGLQGVGADAAYFQSKIQQDTRETPYESDTDIHLKSGEKLSQADALLRVTSGQDLFDLIEQIQEVKYFPWDAVVAKVINYLSHDQVRSLIQTLKGFEHRPHVESILANRLGDLGCLEEAQELLQYSLARSVPNGWDRQYDGGSRLSAVQALVKFDPEDGRAKAYDLLVDDYLAGWRRPSAMINNLEDYLPLLFEQVPLAEIWQEISEHVYQLREFARYDMLPPQADVNRLRWTIVLPRLIADTARMGVPEVREEVHRVCYKLCLDPAFDADTTVLLTSMLEGDESQICQGLAILESWLAVRHEAVAKFVDRISYLCTSPDISIRTMATGLADNLAISAPLPSPRPLPATYTLELPDFPVYSECTPFSALLPGASFPDTDDPLEMVRPFQDEFELLSKLSGTPQQNLINRAALLMKILAPEELWNKQAEEKMKAWLRAAGLELMYHRLRPQQALRALHYVVAELADAGKLKFDALDLIEHLLRQHDKMMSHVEPVRRPRDIILPDRDEVRSSHAPDWKTRGAEAFASMPEQLQDGRFVLAEMTRICHLSWEKPTEYRFSMLCHPDWPVDSELLHPYDFYPYKSHWRAEDYPSGVHVKQAAIAIYGHPRIVEFGGGPWLAFNPNVAKSLGWKYSASGLFRWEDTEGNIAVESIWWKDGPLDRQPYHDDECSEGWIIAASANAQQRMRRALWPIARQMAVIRSSRGEGGGETAQSFSQRRTLS